MVQEVQTWVWITNETTLETIESIGTSSFKIKEWRQTTGRYLSKATVPQTYIYFYYQSSAGRDSWMLTTALTISEMSGKTEYSISNGGIRVPSAWTYQISLSAKAWWGTYTGTVYLKRGTDSGSETIYSLYGASSTTETKTFIIDLGKFDILTIWAEFHYNGSASAATVKQYFDYITIQQL